MKLPLASDLTYFPKSLMFSICLFGFLSLFFIPQAKATPNFFSERPRKTQQILKKQKAALQNPLYQRVRVATLTDSSLALANSSGIVNSDSDQKKEKEVETFYRLNLFPDVELAVYFEKTYSHADQTQSWVGRVVGEPLSQFVVTPHGQIASGEVISKKGHFFFHALSSDEILIAEIKPERSENPENPENPEISQQKAEKDDVVIPPGDVSPSRSRPRQPTNPELTFSSANNGTVIDIFVLYTTSAANADSSIATTIQNTISWVNATLDRSCTETSFRLVGTAQTNYTESGSLGTDIVRLYYPNDGYLDEAYTYKQNSGADIVHLWTENGNDACGVAFLPGPALDGGAPFAFGVDKRACGASTMAHELGHNLGINHDRYQDQAKIGESDPYGAAYGYVGLEHEHRDIMSYNTLCADHGLYCERLPLYSNPRISVNGTPFGQAGFEDAALHIRQRKMYVANYVDALSEPSAPTFSLCQQGKDKDLSKGCFLATVAYEQSTPGPKNPTSLRNLKNLRSEKTKRISDLDLLRNFRDNHLMKTALGKKFVQWYYRISPPLAHEIALSKTGRFLMWTALQPVIWILRYPSAFFFILFSVFFLVLVMAMVRVGVGVKVKVKVKVRVLKILFLFPFLALSLFIFPSNGQGSSVLSDGSHQQAQYASLLGVLQRSRVGVDYDTANQAEEFNNSPLQETEDHQIITPYGRMIFGPIGAEFFYSVPYETKTQYTNARTGPQEINDQRSSWGFNFSLQPWRALLGGISYWQKQETDQLKSSSSVSYPTAAREILYEEKGKGLSLTIPLLTPALLLSLQGEQRTRSSALAPEVSNFVSMGGLSVWPLYPLKLGFGFDLLYHPEVRKIAAETSGMGAFQETLKMTGSALFETNKMAFYFVRSFVGEFEYSTQKEQGLNLEGTDGSGSSSTETITQEIFWSVGAALFLENLIVDLHGRKKTQEFGSLTNTENSWGLAARFLF